MAGKLTEAVFLETQRERKLKAEREDYEREHPKPWYLIRKQKGNDNAKRNRNTDNA